MRPLELRLSVPAALRWILLALMAALALALLLGLYRDVYAVLGGENVMMRAFAETVGLIVALGVAEWVTN